MAPTLPIPIRVAAGLIGTTVDRLSTLPRDLPVLGVTLAGQAFRLSLKARQQVAELATRGDELLSGLGGGPAAEPSWATFDEDLDDEPAPAANKAADEAAPTTTPATTAQPRIATEWADLPELSVSALRDRLEGQGIPAISAALAAEEAGRARPAQLTLLHNRLATAQHR